MHSAPTLNLYTVDYPFETLVQRAKANPPKLILNPDFQREYKWDKEGWTRASKFIESCLMRIPLPSCYFAEDKNRAQLVIDGVQRITTIMRFMNDDFALEGLSAYPALEGKKFSELGELASDLETTTIRCIVLRHENPKELISEIFSRLNKGAVELSDQEIRHALFPGRFDDMLTTLSKLPSIRDFKKGRNGSTRKNSRESEELVLRYFAFRETGGQYSGRLSSFLDKYMEQASALKASPLKELEADFRNALRACQTIFDDNEIFSDISRERNRQGTVYFDLLMHSLPSIDPTLLENKRAEIRAAYKDLCSSAEFKRLIAGGLQRTTSIAQRNSLWRERLQAATS